MRMFVVIAVLGMASISARPALGQSQADQDACRPDVMRLCAQEIPDRDRIVGCLTRSKLQLSPACSVVFSRPHG